MKTEIKKNAFWCKNAVTEEIFSHVDLLLCDDEYKWLSRGRTKSTKQSNRYKVFILLLLKVAYCTNYCNCCWGWGGLVLYVPAFRQESSILGTDKFHMGFFFENISNTLRLEVHRNFISCVVVVAKVQTKNDIYAFIHVRWICLQWYLSVASGVRY